MALSPLNAAAVLVGLAIFAWLYSRRSLRGNGLRQPPGPPGLPLIGNLRDVPQPNGFPWLTYRQWSRDYGSDIIRLNVLGTNIVVVNSMEIATDLFEKRSNIYSDRSDMVMLNELVGFGWGLAFRRYCDAWRDSRKMAHHILHSTPVKQYRPIEQKATHELLRRLLSGTEFMDGLRHMAGLLIMSLSYDIEVLPDGDPYVEMAEAAIQSITATTNAGSYLVDSLPILKYIPEWFPGADFQRQARVWRESVNRLFREPFDIVKERMDAGVVRECAAKSLIEAFGKTAKDPAYTEDIIRSTLGSIYVGGADTTVSALGTFFLAMVLYPEVQEKARKELDKVIGPDRLPTFADLPSLPYIDAIVKETLRWNPVVPLDVPHRSTADDVYNGYFIPKGSLVVGNTWAVLHDETMYPDSSAFKPERFLKDGALNPEIRDPVNAAFGYGRRICPGRFLAQDSIWITVASVLASFEIKKAKGCDGKPVTPDGEYIRGFLCYPKPFPCVIQPRSKEHETLILETLDQH